MTSLAKVWTDYWFKPADTFNLAVFRIVVVGVQLVILLTNYHSLVNMTAGFPDDLYEPLLALRALTLDIVSSSRPSQTFVLAIYCLAVLSAFTSLIGLRTNLSLVVLWVSSLFLQGYAYSFGEMHHREAIFIIVLFVLAISPSGGSLSIDALRRRENRPGPGSTSLNVDESRFARWPLLLVLWMFALFYLSGDISKLKLGGADLGGLALPTMDWANGYTLQYYLARDGLRFPGRAGSEIAVWMSQHHGLVLLSQYVVVAFQATFWLCIFVPRLLWLYVPLGLFFHSANWFLLGAPFPQWIACYAAFIPWSAIRHRTRELSRDSGIERLSTELGPEPVDAFLVYDGDCPFCSKYADLIRIRAHLGTLQLVNAREAHPVGDEIKNRFDLDEGMVLKIGSSYFHGDDCIHALALLSDSAGMFGTVNAAIFRSPLLSRLLYPGLRAGRNLALKLLGRERLQSTH